MAYEFQTFFYNDYYLLESIGLVPRSSNNILTSTYEKLDITRYFSLLLSISRYCFNPTAYTEHFFHRIYVIYTAGNIIIFRSQIDELLKSDYLDTNHVDAFGIMLAKKNQPCPGFYDQFIFAFSFYWVS